MRSIFHGRVKDGKFQPDQKEALSAAIASFEGKQISVVIEKRRQNRSLQANSYYWGVVIPYLSEYTGYEREELHEALKWRFLRVHGEHIETIKSTSELDTAQFAHFVDQCRQLAAELGVVIPDPGVAA